MPLRYPYLLLSLGLTSLLLLTGLHRPSPSSPTFQLPGLLPSYLFPSTHLVFPSPRLKREQERRYAHLRHPRIPHSDRISPSTHGKYLFVTLTRNIESQLPDLLNTIVVLVNFLGASRVRFSIYEGPSSDETPAILTDTLGPMLRKLGVPDEDVIIKTDRPAVDFSAVHRIEALAGLRNEALAPLWTQEGWGESTVAVVYFNDVYLRARDVLELLHQHTRAGEKAGAETGMTTGIDWWRRHPEYFYDVWVARTMQGDLFYPISPPSWSPSDAFLTTSPVSREAYDNLQPFQAFASWAGMAVLAATPFLGANGLRFRRSDPMRKDECAGSECELICRDLWERGFGRVQVVPSVQLAYERDVASDIVSTLSTQMGELGWYEETPNPQHDHTINWQREPPSQVKCHAWPEKTGLDGNVWETVEWGPPYPGFDL